MKKKKIGVVGSTNIDMFELFVAGRALVIAAGEK